MLPVRRTLCDVLLAARERTNPDGWVYLPDAQEFELATPCILIDLDDGDFEEDDAGFPVIAKQMGFPVCGLDSATIEDTAEWARQFQDPPSEALLLESFSYYWKFDAFLPEPGAPDPPSSEESRARFDREFYESLGPERSGTECKREGCSRGAVQLSVLCRVHHFEMIQKRPCPFAD